MISIRILNNIEISTQYIKFVKIIDIAYNR